LMATGLVNNDVERRPQESNGRLYLVAVLDTANTASDIVLCRIPVAFCCLHHQFD
ncbi:jg21772, partial [Pararge aegeria aegeria]